MTVKRTRTRRRRVAVLSVRHHPASDSVLAGVREYAERHGGWSLLLVRHDVTLFTRCLERFDGDGAIVHDVAAAPRDGPIRAAVPTVVVADGEPPPGYAAVVLDARAAARRALHYFARKGYRTVGYFDARDVPMSRSLWEGLTAAAADEGVECLRFIHGPRMVPGPGWQLQDQLDDLGEWLTHRPRPFALLAADDTHAQRAVAAAQQAGLHVPNDVAILGVGNDETFCQFSRPSLSSVDLGAERLGSEAARLLDGLMRGRRPPRRPLLIAPGDVVQRQSSDVFAVHDPEVIAALSFIRERLDEPIGVEDLVEHTRVSRSNLQRRFLRALGYSPGRAIRQARLDRVRHYLSQTRLPLADVAARCGYNGLSQLSRDFRQATGQSPTQFRQHESPPVTTDSAQ